MSVPISVQNITELLIHFKDNTYNVSSETPEAAAALSTCKALLELDYQVAEINNSDGLLCPHYPSRILICEKELAPVNKNIQTTEEALQLDNGFDINELRRLIPKSRKARCRTRFPIPVILFNGKNICRSATIALPYEIYARETSEFIYDYITGTSETTVGDEEQRDEDDSNNHEALGIEPLAINHDIQLLKLCKVTTIFDLMVELQKVKLGLYVSSSERADRLNRYSEFDIVDIPYPGCEFFTEFYKSYREVTDLKFNWSQSMINKTVTIPDSIKSLNIQIPYENYKEWDIAELTKNYLVLILYHLRHIESGILIHCISGWDRTPLFISLVRISLWADGLIHKSLDPYQILYFTLAYDWMLFGHNLKDRLAKKEEVLFFCFRMLPFLDKTSMKSLNITEKPTNNGNNVTDTENNSAQGESEQDRSNDSVNLNEALSGESRSTTPDNNPSRPPTCSPTTPPNNPRNGSSPIPIVASTSRNDNCSSSKASNDNWSKIGSTDSFSSNPDRRLEFRFMNLRKVRQTMQNVYFANIQ